MCRWMPVLTWLISFSFLNIHLRHWPNPIILRCIFCPAPSTDENIWYCISPHFFLAISLARMPVYLARPQDSTLTNSTINDFQTAVNSLPQFKENFQIFWLISGSHLSANQRAATLPWPITCRGFSKIQRRAITAARLTNERRAMAACWDSW